MVRSLNEIPNYDRAVTREYNRVRECELEFKNRGYPAFLNIECLKMLTYFLRKR